MSQSSLNLDLAVNCPEPLQRIQERLGTMQDILNSPTEQGTIEDILVSVPNAHT